MIRFQGRSAWITVIKAKPTSVGCKLYTVASDGYLLDFRIYRGKGGYNTSQNILQQVVVSLVESWQGWPLPVFFDKLYTSLALCNELLQLGIQSCDTCRPNRAGGPRNLRPMMAQLAEGELIAWQRGQPGCVVWNDAKPMVCLSTHRRVDTVIDLPAQHGCPANTRLAAAADYNNNKKGHVDQVE